MCATDQDGESTSCSDFADFGKRVRDKIADSPSLFVQAYTAKKMVRNSTPFIFRHLVCDDWQSFVELHSITVDDFTIVFTSNVYRQLFQEMSYSLLLFWLISWCYQKMSRLTSDFPVPVAPTTATSGVRPVVLTMLENRQTVLLNIKPMLTC